MTASGIDSTRTGAPAAAPPAAADQSPAAGFRGKDVRIVESSQESLRTDDPAAIDQWKADAGETLITEEKASLAGGPPLTFDEPEEPAAAEKSPGRATKEAPSSPPAAAVRAPAAAAPARPEAAAVSSARISESVDQAKRGGVLGVIMSLVNMIKGLFLPAPPAAAAGTGGSPNSSLWMEAIGDLRGALGELEEIRDQVASPTAQLTGKAPELQEALRERGSRHPLKRLIDPAQTLEALKHKKYALDALAAHPDMAAGRRERLAGNIQAAAAVISELMETKYSPITKELGPLAKSSLRAFGIVGGGNPYVEMSRNEQLFSQVQDANVRTWLAGALDILGSAGRLLADSAAGRESSVDVGQLQGQLKSFGRESAAQKAFPHADLLAASGERD